MLDDDDGTTEESGDDRWVSLTVASLALSSRVSTMLFIGAAFALLLGVIGAAATYSALSQDVGEVALFRSNHSSLVLAQSSQALLTSLLPAGLLLAAGAAIRLQAARFEAEFLDG